MKVSKAIVSLLVFSLLIDAKAFTVAFDLLPSLSLGGYINVLGAAGGRTSGHEEITRQALVFAQVALKEEKIDAFSFEERQMLFEDTDQTRLGVNGSRTLNAIIHGNYMTDSPAKKVDAAPIAGWENEFWIDHFNNPKTFPQLLSLTPEQRAQRRKHSELNWRGDWHNNPDGQVLHFLRNYDNTGGKKSLMSARTTCDFARQHMLSMVKRAASLWGRAEALKNNGRSTPKKIDEQKERALFLFGHVTHTLQDSFSPAHSIRAIDTDAKDPAYQNFNMTDVCYYGKKQQEGLDSKAAQACFHPWYDIKNAHGIPDDAHDGEFKDSIWIRSENQRQIAQGFWGAFYNEPVEATNTPYPFNKGFTYINHEARLARAATARYLYILARYLYDVRQGLEDKGYVELEKRMVTQLFEGSLPVGQGGLSAPRLNIMPDGVLRCDKLAN